MLHLPLNDISRLHALTKDAERVAIVAHTHPDGDAIGSACALCAFLQSLGKEACVILPDSVDQTLKFMTQDVVPLVWTDDPASAAAIISSRDLLFCLDCNAWDRTAGMAEALSGAKAAKVLIDHHLGPDTEAFDLCFSKSDISSASELLYWILLTFPEVGADASKLPEAAARSLMTGMTTDTNNFANSVFPTTFEMAADLIAAGVDRDAILASLYNNYHERRFRLMGHMLKDVMTITPEGAACMILRKDDRQAYGVNEGETDGFVNLPLGIGSVRMSIFLKEDEGHYRVSIRSRKDLAINQFAKDCFHGGGHAQASGGKLYWPADIPGPDAAESYVLAALKDFLKNR